MTRRSARSPLRAVAVVSVVLAALLAPVVEAQGTAPATSVRTIVVGAWDAVLGVGGSVAHVSAPVAAGDAVLVGADWGGDDDLDVHVRAGSEGAWGEWHGLHLPDDHAPDPAAAEAASADTTASEPVWIGRADQLQVRVSGASRPPPVRVRAVAVSGGDGLGFTPRGLRAGTAGAATAQPAIVSRASWGADESLRRDEPTRAPEVRFAVVHHTAGSNSYAPSESDDVVRAIYAYHVNVRGWDDIGYNFLVDRFGRVFEGRAGGVTEAVVGAHAAGWNWASTGVAVMGNFVNATPSPEAVGALDRLLAWKLDHHHVDPRGTTMEVAGGGSSNRYQRGSVVELPTVIGHRTTNSTACPGDRLFSALIDAGGRSVVADRLDTIGMPKAYGGPLPRLEQAVTGPRPRWDVDFTEPVQWQLSVSGRDGQVVRSTSGSGLDVDVEWDLHDADGGGAALVPPGEYHARLTATGASGAITPVETRLALTAPVDRYGGLERIETSVKLSRWAFDRSDRVVLATAAAFPDAMVASPLAGSLGAPVLLVPPDGLPQIVADELARLGAEEAYVVGGPARIPTAIDGALRQAGIARVERLAGPTRFDTAAAVARAVIDREGPTEVLLALGEHPDPLRAFPDALTAGGFGAARGLPVLLVQPGGLPDPTRRVLAEVRPGMIVVSSGDAVTGSVQQAAVTVSGGRPLTRIEGADRYDTARLVADEWLRRAAADAAADRPNPDAPPPGVEVVLATGDNWPDALGAAAAAAERGAAFLLVSNGSLDGSPATGRWLTQRAAAVTHAVLSGGDQAIAPAVQDQVARIVTSAGPNTLPRSPWGDAPVAAPLLGLPGLLAGG